MPEQGRLAPQDHRVVTRAQWLEARAKLAASQQRMGWGFTWLSSGGSDFNRDFGVSFTPEELAGKRATYNSVFFKDPAGQIFHTCSAYARGIDMRNTAYHYLDLVPKGRDEGGRSQYWVRRHDEYGR